MILPRERPLRDDPRIEVWLHAFAFPGRVVETAARAAEGWGFDGMLLADSQTLNTEIWVELGMAAAATERLRLGPGVTNPFTRHPSVTASAAATLQVESGGRAVLGLGRGDSALRQIGREPVHAAELERALVAIQAYLRGGTVEARRVREPASPGSTTAPALPKVPVTVAASGPHVIELAARHAERVDFTVGAEPDRLRWALETRARRSADVSLGAFVNVAVDPDPAVARDLVRGSAAIFARFSAEGAPARRALRRHPRGDRADRRRLRRVQHGHASADHSPALGDEFLDLFAVAGAPDEVAERLVAIGELGIEQLVIVPCSLDTSAEDLAALERAVRGRGAAPPALGRSAGGAQGRTLTPCQPKRSQLRSTWPSIPRTAPVSSSAARSASSARPS